MDNLRSLPVAVVSSAFQKAVTQFVRQTQTIAESASHLYANAQTLLLRALGLENWQPPETLTYESSFAQAFGQSERLDAEHFQPKYAALRDFLKSKGAFRLGDRLTEPLRRGISPEYVEEVGDVIVINSKHVGKSQVEIESNRFTSRAILNEASGDKGQVRVGDVL